MCALMCSNLGRVRGTVMSEGTDQNGAGPLKWRQPVATLGVLVV